MHMSFHRLPLVRGTLIVLSLVCCACTSKVQPVVAQSKEINVADSDWPQWAGPNRDHHSGATGLLKQWPAAGPKQLWKFDNAGLGYSSFSVADGQLYTLGTVDGSNYAICLDVNSGKQLWRTRLGPAIPESAYNQGWAGGPRSTPTVTPKGIVVLDDGGALFCLNSETGDPIWQRHLVDDFGGQIPKWGYSDSPLVDGDRLIVLPGKDKFLVALDLATGKEIFASQGFEEPAHYVSVIKHNVGGVDMYITAAASGLVGFSAQDGSVLWTNTASGNGVATIPTPLVRDNHVYHTSAYGTGCVLVELAAKGGQVSADQVYFSKTMQNHHGGAVLVGDHVYGFKKGGGWVCHDFMTGKLTWRKRITGDGSASVTYADGRLYVYGSNSGKCYLVEPSPEEWKERGVLELPEQTQLDRRSGAIWAHPVVADGKLFLRDMDLIYAFDISE